MEEQHLTSAGAGVLWALLALVLLLMGWQFLLASLVSFFLGALAVLRADRVRLAQGATWALLLMYAALAMARVWQA